MISFSSSAHQIEHGKQSYLGHTLIWDTFNKKIVDSKGQKWSDATTHDYAEDMFLQTYGQKLQMRVRYYPLRDLHS